MGTSIFYFFALPPALVRSPLNIKISKQRGEGKKYSIHKMKNSQKDTVFCLRDIVETQDFASLHPRKFLPFPTLPVIFLPVRGRHAQEIDAGGNVRIPLLPSSIHSVTRYSFSNASFDILLASAYTKKCWLLTDKEIGFPL